ncbi:MAG: DUF2764 family protein [Phycisphaerales bacterium]|jgi:hypothetical protein|nr:DUF2764 family protein [Phycisphaerales bacterium]
MASGNNYYLITSLDTLESLTSAPPLSNAEFMAKVADTPGAGALVEVLLLSDDLILRQAILAGEIQEATPAVLTSAQLTDEEPLPEYLVSTDSTPRRIAGDALWAEYYRHASNVAKQYRCNFLIDWLAYEVAMRNALAESRAKTLGLDPNEYLVEPQLGSPDSFSSIIGEWSAAVNPLSGLKVLDRARWDWLSRNDRAYSFENDEIAAYAAKLMLLHRWRRLAQAADDRQG